MDLPTRRSEIQKKVEITPSQLKEAFIKIWSWKQVIEMWAHRYKNLPGVSPHLEHYMNNIERIFRKNYRPTLEDLIKSPKDGKSTQIEEKEFTFNILNNSYKFVDLNQKNSIINFKDLLSWQAYYDKPIALLFVASLGSYCEEIDQREYDDIMKNYTGNKTAKKLGITSNTNHVFHRNVLHQSLNLFGQILDNWSTEKPKCIVLLTEKELLEKRVIGQNISFTQFFGENCQWGSNPQNSQPFRIKDSDVNTAKNEMEMKVDESTTSQPRKFGQNEKQYINQIIQFIKKQFDNERVSRSFSKPLFIIENSDCADPKQMKQVCLEIDKKLNLLNFLFRCFTVEFAEVFVEKMDNTFLFYDINQSYFEQRDDKKKLNWSHPMPFESVTKFQPTKYDNLYNFSSVCLRFFIANFFVIIIPNLFT
ncbi:hypothetical protein RFI_07725 [Reticulomyxa filosa]|uniref:Uncharacterized protein n=1 Tax=Reticulomyxa filosa TaxID=46433 RepID=X6NVV9_RETFI|nr:hypothetical protein RFI_07725 [Reticulomyxa filosa]|eukprot:ETO29392.1 hypothetical protein RFI_07725 [Reticulomyxa filosa]